MELSDAQEKRLFALFALHLFLLALFLHAVTKAPTCGLHTHEPSSLLTLNFFFFSELDQEWITITVQWESLQEQWVACRTFPRVPLSR